jgi:MFS superfamily sulfate permease-like transporter
MKPAASTDSHPHRMPFLQGLLPLDPAQPPHDIIAGITLAALGIPEVMGYTKIAGTPTVTGLYTMSLPLIVCGLWCIASTGGRSRLRNSRHPRGHADGRRRIG